MKESETPGLINYSLHTMGRSAGLRIIEHEKVLLGKQDLPRNRLNSVGYVEAVSALTGQCFTGSCFLSRI